MKTIHTRLLLLLFVSLFLNACEDQDDRLPEPSAIDAHKFVWRGMNALYLWQEDVPNLADKRFATNTEFQSFLGQFSTPEDLFQSLLYLPPNSNSGSVVDRYSWIVDDYTQLEQQLGGTTKNSGVEYTLTLVGTNQVVGFVRYIIPNSDAANKDIQRGAIFYGVNGTSLTLNNYIRLLNSADENYTLNLADLSFDTNNNPVITPNGKSVALTKTSLSENPIFIKKVIQNGAHKIGYLMYNGFYDEYDVALNDAFGYFKSEGITDLVLDLRYNGGGSVVTAARLASMITGQFTGQIFTELSYNKKRTALNRRYNFVSTINGVALNQLNLSRLYVLTTKDTASASELIINGLDPYINIIQIGDNTDGKNVASVTLYDSTGFNKSNVNTSHNYAMQLIVARSVNAVGFGDYLGGLEPEHKILERVNSMGVLGDPAEPLLSTAIAKITGTTTRIAADKTSNSLLPLTDSKTLRGQKQMYFSPNP